MYSRSFLLLSFVLYTSTFHFVASQDCGKKNLPDITFVAGATADDEKNPVGYWPWMASLGFYNTEKKWNHQCGATLVTNRHFLTAAHCVNEMFKIRIGDSNHSSEADDTNAIDLEVLNHSIHPNYNGITSYYDIAILETVSLTFSTAISPVCLPEKPSDDIQKYDNYHVHVTGWGQKNRHKNVSNQLKRVALKIHTSSFCNKTYGQSSLSTKEKIDEILPQLFQNHILCAGEDTGNLGSCIGDSGGPLMYLDSDIDRWIQIATVHGGIGGCGNIDFPGIYIRLYDPSILNFIKSEIYSNFTAIKYEANSEFIMYRGETRNGKPFGNGTMIYKNGDKYEGEWVDGKHHGSGNLTYAPNGNINIKHYSGNFENNEFSGLGIIILTNGNIYEGHFKNGLINGFGKVVSSSGDIYEGLFDNDKMSGYGTYTWKIGNKYEGEWMDGKRNGYGNLTMGKDAESDVLLYSGNWENNQRSGLGVLIWKNGVKYEGSWENHVRNGFGKMFYPKGSWEGQWKNDSPIGSGIWTRKNGTKVEGVTFSDN